MYGASSSTSSTFTNRPPTRADKVQLQRSVRVHCAVETPSELTPDAQIASAVRSYYAAWGKEDADGMIAYIADDCVYHDMAFQDPFVGKTAIRSYFAEILKYYDPEVSFELDDICVDPSGKVGVEWSLHLSRSDLDRRNALGMGRVNEENKIEYAREIAEPSIKPGHNAMKVMTVVVPLVKKLGPNADPAILKKLPVASALLWAFYGWYLWNAFFALDAPGVPGLGTSAETLEKLLHEGVNFFYFNPFLQRLGLDFIPSVPEHPVDEAIFNFVGAWGLMFLPVMLTDSRSQKMSPPLRWGFWIGTWFLTNLFFIPYNATRLAPTMEPEQDDSSQPLPSWSPIVAAISGFMGVFSIGWALYGRPEYGDLAQRLTYALDMFHSDRIFWLFVWDMALYSIFQVVLLNKRAGSECYLPFAGLVLFLFNTIQQPQEENEITVDSK